MTGTRFSGYEVAGTRPSTPAVVDSGAFQADPTYVISAGTFRLVIGVDGAAASIGTRAEQGFRVLDLDDVGPLELGTTGAGTRRSAHGVAGAVGATAAHVHLIVPRLHRRLSSSFGRRFGSFPRSRARLFF